MNNRKLSFSICVPVYKGAKRLQSALNSLFSQDTAFDLEIIIGDDNPPSCKKEIENTKRIIYSYKDKRIRYYKNKTNLGSAQNIKNLAEKAKNDIIFYLCQDDVLARDALRKTHDAFFLSDNVGVVTRPYYWYLKDIHKPIRAVLPYDSKKDSVLSIYDGKKAFIKIFETLGQISGLGFLRKVINIPFGDECFTGHIYPFAGILRNYRCVFLKDYTVAVLLTDSQARNVSSIYDLSPFGSWLNMFRSVFAEKRYRKFKEWGVEHITTHYVGLIQLKNYAKSGVLKREIKILLENRWQNIFNPKFLGYVAVSLITPRSILVRMADFYKLYLNSRTLPKIDFNY